MRILYLSFFYPPYNNIAAVRGGKLSKWLLRQGADVRVVTAAPQPYPEAIRCELPEERVIRSSWVDIDGLARAFLRMALGKAANSSGGSSGSPGTFETWYRTLLHWPDGQRGWVRPAIRTVCDQLNGWKPDVIYASAPPHSSLILGKKLANIYDVPLVVEFRDLWSGNHYLDFLPRWRRWLDANWEKRLLSCSSGLVTVSVPLADSLRKRYEQAVLTLPNGWDPDDVCDASVASLKKHEDKCFQIVYTGILYGEKQDVSPLFAAIAQMPEIQVHFYGRQFGYAEMKARAYGVTDKVFFHDPVPREDALRLQREADALLLALWNDPRQRGVYTGKLFEYLASGRPIIALGPRGNVASEMIESLNTGAVANTSGEVSEILKKWQQKCPRGVSRDIILPWSHETLAITLLDFLENVIDQHV